MSINLQQLKTFAVQRLKEPSTWRGVVLVATALGAALTPDQQEAIVTVGLGLAGAVGAITPDTKTVPAVADSTDSTAAVAAVAPTVDTSSTVVAEQEKAVADAVSTDPNGS